MKPAPSVKMDTTILEYQDFVKEVYGMPNERHFSMEEMLSNIQRFAMRALKGIRKGDVDKTKLNLMISLSWFTSTLNRLQINLEDAIWKRFPYVCSYCGNLPCVCGKEKIENRKNIISDETKKPETLADFQLMFSEIYQPNQRSLEHAGVHLAEELGEFSEAILSYRGSHREEIFNDITEEAADLFSTMMGVFNSLDINVAEELSKTFTSGCHVCKSAPCKCDFEFVMNFRS